MGHVFIHNNISMTIITYPLTEIFSSVFVLFLLIYGTKIIKLKMSVKTNNDNARRKHKKKQQNVKVLTGMD